MAEKVQSQPGGGGKGAPPDLSNVVSEDELLAFVNQQAEFDRQLKRIGEEKKRARKKMQARGMKLGNFDIAYKYYQQDDPEAEADMREQLRYMKILSVITGEQLDIFKHTQAAADGERAYQLGFKNGVTGAERQPGEEIHVDDHAEWQRGYMDGQKKIAEGYRTIKANEETDEDEEDAAANDDFPDEPGEDDEDLQAHQDDDGDDDEPAEVKPEPEPSEGDYDLG